MRRKHVCWMLAFCSCISMASAQVTGSGTTNVIPIWTGTTVLGDSPMIASGTNIGLGIEKPTAKLDVETTSKTQPAILGSDSASSGSTVGIEGISLSPTGDGILGVVTAATGTAWGVSGVSTSTTAGGGVVGLTSNANGGTGVLGDDSATTGPNNGVVGSVYSADNTGANGVLGISNATTGANFGVTGENLNTDTSLLSAGVRGVAPVYAGFFQNVICTAPNTCTVYAGTAGLFVTASGGNVLTGAVANSQDQFSNVFRVDSTGKGFFDGGTQTGGADFAESVAVAEGSRDYQPGDLLVVDPSANRQLTLASEPYSPLVAGIYSTKPGVLATLHKMTETRENEIPLAIVGIVPCKVSAENGSIRRGDLLVTSSIPGYAMRGTDRGRMLGAVVGKALEPLSEGKGVIQVLVTLQ
jgi:trimeric autotransporter adhesin